MYTVSEKENELFVATCDQLAAIAVMKWNPLVRYLMGWCNCGKDLAEDALSEIICKLLGVEIGNGHLLKFNQDFATREPRDIKGHCAFLAYQARARITCFRNSNRFVHMEETEQDFQAHLGKAVQGVTKHSTNEIEFSEKEHDTEKLCKVLLFVFAKVCKEHKVNAENAYACKLNMFDGLSLPDTVVKVWNPLNKSEIDARCNSLSQSKNRIFRYMRETLINDPFVKEYITNHMGDMFRNNKYFQNKMPAA